MGASSRYEPTRIERLSARVCHLRTLGALLIAAALWVLLNRALEQRGLDPIDASPFRWLQRASILVNGLLVFVALRARAVRRERSRRVEQDLRDALAAAAALRQDEGARQARTRH